MSREDSSSLLLCIGEQTIVLQYSTYSHPSNGTSIEGRLRGVEWSTDLHVSKTTSLPLFLSFTSARHVQPTRELFYDPVPAHSHLLSLQAATKGYNSLSTPQSMYMKGGPQRSDLELGDLGSSIFYDEVRSPPAPPLASLTTKQTGRCDTRRHPIPRFLHHLPLSPIRPFPLFSLDGVIREDQECDREDSS